MDFEKAFDTVKWTYLDKVLEHSDSEIDFDNGFTSCTLILQVVLLKIAIQHLFSILLEVMEKDVNYHHIYLSFGLN